MFVKALKKILVVDDDPDIVESLKLVLEEEGYSVTTASKPDEIPNFSNGLKKNSDLPDIILLDIFLSGNDGRQFAKELKEKEYTKKIPIIMISAHPYALDTAKDYGADDVISKPFNIDSLLSKVEKNISKAIN